MKLCLAMLVAVATASMAHAKTFSFNDGSIGDVDVTLTNAATSGQVDFNIDTSGLNGGLNIRAVFFTVDFDVNAGGLGLPLVDPSPLPSGEAFDYNANEGGFNPVAGISADSRLRFGVLDSGSNCCDDGLDSTETFSGTLQRFNIPGDLSVLNFTQIAIQVEGEGFFTPQVPVPASLPLLVGGLGLAGFVFRNRKRKTE